MRFVFISSVEESWGGSEELWAGSATSLAEMGHKVSAFKKNVTSHPRVRKLSSLGCTTRDLISLFPVPTIPVPFVRTLQGMLVNRVTPVLLRRQLERLRPDLVVVSQGDNFNGFYNAVDL